MAPKAQLHAVMPRGAAAKRALLQVVDAKLVDLDRGLGETVEAMDRGDVDISDLDWENELAPLPAHDKDG